MIRHVIRTLHRFRQDSQDMRLQEQPLSQLDVLQKGPNERVREAANAITLMLQNPFLFGDKSTEAIKVLEEAGKLTPKETAKLRTIVQNQEHFHKKADLILILMLLGAAWGVLFALQHLEKKGEWGESESKFGVGVLDVLTAKVGRIYTDKDEKVRFSDVIGCDEAINELKELAHMLKDPERYRRMGVTLPKGVLLTGPPGTGKTLTARALAYEAGCKFLYCTGSEFDEMIVGLGSKRVRALFQEARKSSPAIIFIDELDALGSTRDPTIHAAYRQSVNQILNEMDGFKSDENIMVLAATNLPESLDSALVRSGRFDKKVHFSLPSREAREKLLLKFTKKKRLDPTFNIDVISRRTMGMSGADLRNLVNLATIHMVRENHKQVRMDDFDYAFNQLLMGVRSQRGAKDFSEYEKRAIAIHEAGHTVVSLVRQQLTKFYKVTILPAGQSLGHTAMTPQKDFLSYSREQILEQVDIKLGGRAAEEIFLGESKVTSGCGSDLRRATAELYSFVRQMGMEEADFLQSRDKAHTSDASNHLIDRKVEDILKERYDRVKKILQENQTLLTAIVDALVTHETLDAAKIAEIQARVGLKG